MMKGFVISSVVEPGKWLEPKEAGIRRLAGATLTIELSGDFGGQDALKRIMGGMVEIVLVDGPIE